MENNNSKRWVGLDFKVASDYTHGSPEYYRTLLRQMIGIPELLPGEKNASISPTEHHKGYPPKKSLGGSLFGNFHKGQG